MTRPLIALVSAAALAGTLAGGPPPRSATDAWDDYVRLTERRIDAELATATIGLAADRLAPADAARARTAKGPSLLYLVPVATAGAPGSDEVSGGLRHHWLAAVLVPGVRIADVLAFVQDYDHHAGSFEDVVTSRLLKREGDAFDVLLRLRRKKVITVYYDTFHHVVYRAHGGAAASSRSVATRIVELDGDGTAFREKPPADDRGFMWRLNSYWRFLQTSDGVVVECESLSLSRGIPTGLGWIVSPFVSSVPRESLERTLLSIKAGTLARPRASAAVQSRSAK